MFDNLREQPDSTPFYEEEDLFRDAEEVRSAPPRKPSKPKATSSDGRFLGLMPWQRFALAIMLFITVCVLGAMLLIVTGRIGF